MRSGCRGDRWHRRSDPEEVFEWSAVADEGHVEVFHPLFAAAGTGSPGVAGAPIWRRTVAPEPASCLRRRCYDVVHDDIHVADEDGAGFDAGVAGGAGPEGFFGDAGDEVFAGGDAAVDIGDDLLGVEDFADVVGGADFGAATTGHAGVEGEEVPAGVLLGLGDADDAGFFDLLHGDGFEATHFGVGVGAGGGEGGGDDVLDLHLGQGHEEDHDESCVRPPQELVGGDVNGGEDLGDGVADGCPVIPRFGVVGDACAFEEVTAKTESEEEGEGGVVFPLVAEGITGKEGLRWFRGRVRVGRG